MPHHIWAEKPVARRRSGFRFTAGDGLLVAWLRGDLTAHPTACLAAYWHKPRFWSGTHESAASFQTFWQVLGEHGADVILNGHDHDYERFAPQDPTGEPDSTGAASSSSAREARICAASPRTSPAARCATPTFGILRLTLAVDSDQWSFLPVAGQVSPTTDLPRATR